MHAINFWAPPLSTGQLFNSPDNFPYRRVGNPPRSPYSAVMTIADLVLSVSWMQYAVCRGRSELFFAPFSERPQARARREEIAASLCRICPVQQECQEYARQHREYGFWGGENELERHNAGFTLVDPIGLPDTRVKPKQR